MDWQQGVLIILTCVIGGLLVGYLLSYIIITRILKEPFKNPFAKKRETTAVTGEPLKFTPPDLVVEVESNHRVATEPWTGELLSFQTRVWDTSQDEVPKLPTGLREELNQAYVDMRLANSIVWLSTELGRRSRNLDENYIKLCTSVAIRLDKVTFLMKSQDN